MALERARVYLEQRGYGDRLIVLEASSATVALAAEALGVAESRIAKTLSFLVEERPVLILTEGRARIDNRKFKERFRQKAKMIPPERVEALVGHAPGGVCPFGVNEGVQIYLDESLKPFDTVFPAAGDDHSAVRLSIAELEDCADHIGWVDVCRIEE